MTLRKRMLGALDDIQKAARAAEKDFARYHDVGVHPDIQAAHDLHMEGLREAYRIITEFGNAPEAFEELLKLRAEKSAEFEAIMVLVRIELERPASAEAKVAA